MPTPIWSKVTDDAKTLAGSAEAEAEKLKQWALDGKDSADAAIDKAQSRGWALPIIAGVVIVLAVIIIAWLF